MAYWQVYKAFLEELQFYGFLVVADVQKIFANLSELVEVGHSVLQCIPLLDRSILCRGS